MKILVVDDEDQVREYITWIINRCDSVYEIIGSVHSGKAALELMKNQLPDLVFADITMPGMSGLELLAQIKEKYQEVHVLILTCHNEFEYARTAVKLGADDYILKDEIDIAYMEKRLQLIRDKQKEKVKSALPWLKSNSYFVQLLDSEDTLFFENHDFEKHKIFLQDKAFLVIFLMYSEDNLKYMVSFQSLILHNKEIFPYQNTNLILVANITEDNQEKMRLQIQEMLQDLKKGIMGPVGVSRIYYKIRILRKAINEAGAMFNKEYYGKDRKKVNFKIEVSVSNPMKESSLMYGEARNHIREKKYQKLFELIFEIIDFSKKQHVDVWFLKKGLVALIEDYQDQSGTRVSAERIINSQSISEVREYLEELKVHVISDDINYSQAVSDVIEFLENHFAENIVLLDVAKKIHLNPDYLGRRFKKETGKNFSECLLSIRMERARKLLLTTRKSIMEIAEETGFNNDGYFSTTFKKVFGKTPNEMRKDRIK